MDGIVSMRHYQPFDKQHYGRVIHITGPLSTGEPLTEPDYNIVVQAVKLRRRVSMFQWVEQSVDPIGSSQPQDVMDHDDRKYYYTAEWHEKLIDSTHFYLRSGHQNPPNFPIEPITYIAEHVKVGEVELNEDIKRSFSNFILITSDTRPDVPDVKLHSGFYYHTDNIHEPAVGDVRLQFLLAGLEGTSYTVVGKLNNSGILEPYHSKFGHKVLIVKSGELSLDEVLSQEKFVLSINSWMMRALGTGLLFIAISKLTEVLAESRKSVVNLSFDRINIIAGCLNLFRISRQQHQFFSPAIVSLEECSFELHPGNGPAGHGHSVEPPQTPHRWGNVLLRSYFVLILCENNAKLDLGWVYKDIRNRMRLVIRESW